MTVSDSAFLLTVMTWQPSHYRITSSHVIIMVMQIILSEVLLNRLVRKPFR